MRTDRRKISGKKVLPAILTGTVLISVLASGCGKKDQTEDVSSSEQETQSQAIDNTIEWNGKTYTYNRNLTNILFIGVDATDPIGESYEPGSAGQADCIILLSLDYETEQATILQINRNTMTTLDVYDDKGNRTGSAEGQLCLQYAYSIGGESSSWAVKKTVGSILYGVSVDGYFTMEMDAIGELNDAMGGVDITMTEDYTDIDSAFVEGTTVHLEGDQAERFVRYRDTSVFNSIEDRMSRQVEYITAMISAMRAQGGTELYDIISPYLGTEVVTDMSAEELNALSSYEYLTDEVQYLPGEEVMGDVFEEYHLDEDALQDLLISIFYTEIE